MPRRIAPRALLILLLAVAACGGGEADPPADTTTSTQAPTEVDAQLAVALTDLAARLGVAEDDIYVRSYDAVTWPDGSIGCPQPDMSYTQALVDGIQILLDVDGQTYAYHAAGDADPSYCENPVDPVGQS